MRGGIRQFINVVQEFSLKYAPQIQNLNLIFLFAKNIRQN